MRKDNHRPEKTIWETKTFKRIKKPKETVDRPCEKLPNKCLKTFQGYTVYKKDLLEISKKKKKAHDSHYKKVADMMRKKTWFK